MVLQANEISQWWSIIYRMGAISANGMNDIEHYPKIIITYYDENGYEKSIVKSLLRIYGYKKNV